MDTQTSVASLTDLYQLVIDSIKGYKDAAARVKTPELAAFLSNIAVERKEMQMRIGSAIIRVDPDSDLGDGTLKGDLHRAWISIREALASSTDHAVLQECVRGEDYLAERFKTVLEENDTPVEVKQLLREEGTKVAMTKSTINQLAKTIEYDKN
ncbi:MAG: ferritin-like domain-containing protein [Flavobacteriales bacterium]